MSDSSVGGPHPGRQALRDRLKAAQRAFVVEPQAPSRRFALSTHLMSVLEQLAPERLGLYWAVQSEFDAASACLAQAPLRDTPVALPFSFRDPVRMEYRHWDRLPPARRDECGITSCDGAVVVPDVILVPCVGYTACGLRLGHGGGYFDRWLAAHPHVTAVGVAWSVAEIDVAELQPQPHDQRLACVVTERGVR